VVSYVRTVRGFSRNGKIVLSYTFFKGLQLAIQALVYNLFLLSLHFNSTLIGVLDAMPAVTVLLVSFPLGVLADRVGRKRLLLFCAFVNPFTLLGLALFTTPGWQIFFGLANGAVSSFYWVAYPAIIVESSTEGDRQYLFSVNSLLLIGIGSLGYLLGGGVTAFAAGVLHQGANTTAPLRWAMISIFVVGFAGAIPLLWLREAPRTRGAVRAARAYDIGLFVRLLGPDLLLSFGAGAVLSFNQLYFATGFNVSAATLGIFLAVAGVIGAGGSLASPALVRRLGAARAAIFLLASSVPLIAALAVAPALGVALAIYTVWSAVRSAIDPTYTGFAMSRVSEGQRSTLSGLYSVTWAVGFASGPIMTGWLRGATHGFTAPFIVAAACYVVATLALYTFFVRGGRGRAAVAGAPETAAAR
jgi:MFS family permease